MQHPFCDWFHLMTSSSIYQPLINWMVVASYQIWPQGNYTGKQPVYRQFWSKPDWFRSITYWQRFANYCHLISKQSFWVCANECNSSRMRLFAISNPFTWFCCYVLVKLLSFCVILQLNCRLPATMWQFVKEFLNFCLKSTRFWLDFECK